MELFDYDHRVECPSKFTPRLTWEGGARHEITKGRTLTCYEHVRSELESSAGVFSFKDVVDDLDSFEPPCPRELDQGVLVVLRHGGPDEADLPLLLKLAEKPQRLRLLVLRPRPGVEPGYVDPVRSGIPQPLLDVLPDETVFHI